MKKRTKRLVIAVILVCFAFVAGAYAGILTDPLPPHVCAERLQRIQAPPGIAAYVCFGRTPALLGDDRAL